MSAPLKGMTWRHPRGYDPMVAASRAWRERSGIEIAWDQRSLQDFESYPVEELARSYDLIVIDHPHVGQITAEGCLLPLDTPEREAALDDLARHSVGQSFASYFWQGRQWALPIDAAAQVQVYRLDRLSTPLTRWSEVMALARDGRVVLPLLPPHNLMCLYTLMANLGRPCRTDDADDLIDPAVGTEALALLLELVALLDPAMQGMDPIAASEAMALPESRYWVMPLGYGYVNYAIDGFRPIRLGFADIPAAGDEGPVGSALGGTGIAVSAFSNRAESAIDFAFFVASGRVQAGLYAQAGGQPGHGLAWESEAVNTATDGFFRNTRRTLEGAWLRPRHDGYMAFQQAGSERLDAALRSREAPGTTIAALNQLFRESLC